MSEETRQKWIGIVMDLLVEYYGTCDEPRGPEVFIRPMCDRIAEAIGDGATGDVVWESFQQRLRDERMV